MKKLPLLLCVFCSLLSYSTTFGQKWCWGRDGTGPLKANDYCSAAAADKYGNAYFTGQYENIMTVDSVTIKDSVDQMYLVKYDAAGKLLWVRQANSGYGQNFGLSVATDNNANSYVTGYFSPPIIFGNDTLNNGGPGFLVKYDFSGNTAWATGFMGNGQAVAVDNNYNAYVGCSYGGGLYKFTPNGSVLWNITDSTGVLDVYSVTTDKAGDIYMAGSFNDTTKISSYFLYTSLFKNEMFLVKIDPNGNVLWVQQSLSPPTHDTNFINQAYGYSVITDTFSNVYVTGYFNDTVSWGPYKLITDSVNHIFLAKYTSSGHLDWVKMSSNDSAWLGSSLSVDKYNHIYLGGTGNGDTLKFGGRSLFNPHDSMPSSFIMKLDTSGSLLSGSILNNGSPYTGYQIGIASDPTGNFIYMGGTFLDDTVICGPDTLINLSGGTIPYFARWTSIGECIQQISDGAGIATTPAPKASVTLYPNPSSGMFTFQVKSEEVIDKSIVEVYNMLGAKIYSNSFTIDNSQFTINLSGQPNGIYLYRVMDENGSLVGDGKLIIQK